MDFSQLRYLLLREVLQNLLDLFHDGVVHFFQGFGRAEVVVELFHAGGAGDDAGDFLAAQEPGDGHLRGGDLQIFCQSGQFAHRFQALIAQHIHQPGHVFTAGAAAGGDAVIVFAGEDAGGQRAPGGQSQGVFASQGFQFHFDPFAAEHIVLRAARPPAGSG